MKRSPVTVLALALLAVAPQPLVVGSVRDQHGAPIVDAVVSARAADGTVVRAKTDTQGTFALDVGGATRVLVECRFCETETVPVAPDGTALAIVHRYDALKDTGPSAEDFASLPYTHVESSISLTPFTIFENSRSVVPGAQLSSRVISPDGGLLVDAGIPNYDITSGISPFLTTPSYYVQSAQVIDQTYVLPYGDRANDGTFITNPTGASQDGTLTFGTYNAARAGFALGASSASIGYSASPDQRAQRFDAATGGRVTPNSSWELSALSEGSADVGTTASTLLGGSFSGTQAGYHSVSGVRLDVDALADRGTYAYSMRNSIGSTWADSGINGSIASLSGNGIFGAFAARTSAGLYDEGPYIPRIAATLGRVTGVVGTHEHSGALDVTAALAYYNATYGGGTNPQYSNSISNNFVAPYVSASIVPESSHFTFTASGSGGYTVPTFVETYSTPAQYRGNMLTRNSTYQGELTYTDSDRVSASLIALSRTSTGFEPGFANSLGGSVTWQIAPQLSLRTWWMHAGFNETPIEPLFRFGAEPLPSNVGSAWLTYEAKGGLRVDAIWRQDVVNWQPNSHIDGSMSGPLNPDLRWFVGTEKYLNARTIEFGVRFAKR